jgi:hypothetical protein
VRPALVGLLARIGVLLGRCSPWGGLRAFVLALGACGLVMGSAAFVLEDSYVHQRDVRAQAIKARPAKTVKEAEFLIDSAGHNANGMDFALITVWPLKSDAPLPPGVDRWPAPGQAVLSPAAADALGEDRDLFGEVVGSISAEGLVIPRERRVYMRPVREAFDPQKMEKASGFGGPDASIGMGPGSWSVAGVGEARALIVGGLVVPALAVVGIGVGLDGEARARRRRRLVALGAGRRHRLVVDAGEAWLPVAAGTVVGAGLVGVLCVVDIPLPFLDAVLLASDARAAGPSLIVAVLVGHVGALLTSLATRQREGRRRGAGVFSALQSRPARRATICVYAAVATILGASTCPVPPLRSAVYFGGVLTVAITLPAVVALLIVSAGEYLAGLGARTGAVGFLIGGRRLAGFPRRTTRLAFLACFAILSTGQIQIWGDGVFGAQYREAKQAQELLGDSILMSESEMPHDARRDYFLKGLPRGTKVLSYYFDAEDGSVVLSGSCDALRGLSLPCPRKLTEARMPLPASTPALTYFSQVLRNDSLRVVDEKYVKNTSLAGRDSQIVLYSPHGNPLPINGLDKIGCKLYPGCLPLTTPDETWLIGGIPTKSRGEWIVFLGALGVLQVLLAAAVAMGGDVIATVRETASLAVVTGRRRWLIANSLCRTALPLTLAGLLGTAFYMLLPAGMLHRDGRTSTSLPLAMATVLCSILAGLFVAAWGALRTDRAARTWRPGA